MFGRSLQEQIDELRKDLNTLCQEAYINQVSVMTSVPLEYIAEIQVDRDWVATYKIKAYMDAGYI